MGAADGPDAHKATHIFVTGKKGTGKTELAHVLHRSYPYDKVLVDPNGDVKTTPTAIELGPAPPAHWPPQALLDDALRKTTGATRRYHELVVRPDFGAPTYATDIDRALGMAFSHPGPTEIFIDEAHEAFPTSQMVKRPHARRALRHGRHGTLTQIYATPRPMTITPLTISQADWVYVFMLPNPADRKRVAENIGWDPKDFDEAVFSLGDHEYLRYESGANGGQGELLAFPALPANLIRHHKAA